VSAPWSAHDAAHDDVAAQIAACWSAVDAPIALSAAAIGLEATIDAHTRWEEGRILPRYEAVVADPEPTATADVLRRDHEILRRRLDALVDVALRSYAVDVPSLVRAAAVEAVASTWSHHDARERSHVYPRLDPEDMDERFAVAPRRPGAPAWVVPLFDAYRAAVAGAPVDAPSHPLVGKDARALDALVARAFAIGRAVAVAPERSIQQVLRVDDAWRAVLRYALRAAS
jgi:hypothetical protein